MMSRRRLVALVSALLMIALGVAVVVAFIALTQSDRGRDQLRAFAEAQINRRIEGRIHLGRMSGSFLTDLRIDSVRIADNNDSTFLTTGPVEFTFDPRDFADGRIILRSLWVERPVVHVRRELNGEWTHEKIWPQLKRRRGIPPRRSAFGAITVVEQFKAQDGAVLLKLPWAPDSAPRDTIMRVWRWTSLNTEVPRARILYPDSLGMHFRVARLDVDESDPPFKFSEMQGEIRVIRDSVWFESPRFRLPGSVGRGFGKLWVVRNQPLHFTMSIDSDSVALADIAFIDASLPTQGGGRMHLEMRSRPNDARTIEYAITEMDMRAHRSRIRGQMTWGVGPLKAVTLTDVDLEAMPLDADLLTRFNQGPLPVPLRGQLTGRMRGKGGPLADFVIDDFKGTWRDANVPGATTRATARGTVDIRDMAYPVFKGVRLNLESMDLRTAQALDDEFPKLNGTIRGTAVLDSIWGDIRFSQVDVTHVDGDSPESTMRGRARLSWEEIGPVRWEVDGVALPLSFTALAKSFPEVPLRGDYRGNIVSQGSSDLMTVVSDLEGAGGRIESDLRVDMEAPRYELTGRATLRGVNPRVLFERDEAPVGEINGRVVLETVWDSIADLTGNAQLTLDRSTLKGARIFAGTTRLTFGGGRAVLDTLYVESSAVDIAARGALGLSESVSDSVTITARADSLGGLRSWFNRLPTDTLAGSIMLDARARGWVRSFAMDATATTTGLVFLGNQANRLRVESRLVGLPERLGGTLTARSDTLRLGGLVLQVATLTAERDAAGITSLGLNASGPTGTKLAGLGRLEARGDSAFFSVDDLNLTTALQPWRLARPARIATSAGGFRLDSLILRTPSASFATLIGGLPAEGDIDLALEANDVPVADLAELLQFTDNPRGRFDLSARTSGTRAAPTLTGNGQVREGVFRGVRIDTLTFEGRAIADRLELRMGLGRPRRPAINVDARIPFVLGLDGSGISIPGDGRLAGTVRADSLGLDRFESRARGLDGTRGVLAVNLELGGTWDRPRADGTLRLRNGAFAVPALGDVRWRGVEADVTFVGDSIALRNVALNSGGSRIGSARATGWVSMRNPRDPAIALNLQSNTLNVFARPDLADIDVSGRLNLSGTYRAATLRGNLTADRAIVTIPELASKNVISLEGPDRFAVLDTLEVGTAAQQGERAPAFIDNLTIDNVPIQMGRDVWLRSSEANINLGGQVRITRGRVTRGVDAGAVQLALDGPLQTQRGTYRLNLGPVQRTFQVEQGEIRFFGDPDLNPTLSIDALHTVRQYSEQGVRPDVRVRVHLGGSLRQPTASLSTPDSLRVTNADLISYLVTGGPSFEIGGRTGDISNTAANVVISSLGSFLGGKVSGGLCDDAQLSTAGLENTQNRQRNVGASILAGTRFNCAKQIGDRAFVRLDAGLCQVGQLVNQGGGSNPLSFTDALGLKFDYLLGRGVSASFGVEPPTSAVLCAANANSSARGFVPTPRQVGFDIFRVWRF